MNKGVEKMPETKWNVERLKELSRDLSKENDKLKENSGFMQNINKNVESAWQGYAGRSFDQRMDIDIDNMKNVIDNMDALVELLNRVTERCYAACEDDVQSEIRKLRSKV